MWCVWFCGSVVLWFCGSVVLWLCVSVFVCVCASVLVCVVCVSVFVCVNGLTIEAIPPVFKLALCRITKSPKTFLREEPSQNST